AVRPDYRRMSIAERLVALLCDGLSAKGVHALMLEVRASNEPAKALYEQ
ncbi:MAG: GNAT family N-acetyltransferase, partial [Clostridia bacterium]|nr:GNAT family N-acetyltransferase [Clostridia bacterium]